MFVKYVNKDKEITRSLFEKINEKSRSHWFYVRGCGIFRRGFT